MGVDDTNGRGVDTGIIVVAIVFAFIILIIMHIIAGAKTGMKAPAKPTGGDVMHMSNKASESIKSWMEWTQSD